MSESRHDELPRTFGFWSGSAMVAASMIGTGVLVTPGYTILDTGRHDAAILLWIIGGAAALCGAFVIAELATAMPQAGGEYVYVKSALGDLAGYVYGWATLVLGFAGPIAAVAVTASIYLFGAAPKSWFEPAGLKSAWYAADGGPSGVLISISATAIILVFTAAHCLGQRTSSGVQTATTAYKYGTLALLAGAAWFSRHADWHRVAGLFSDMLKLPRELAAWRPQPTGDQNSWQAAFRAIGPIATAMAYIQYTYIGWNATTYIAGELREPAKLLPRCLLAGTAAVMTLYLAVSLSFAAAFSPQDVAAVYAAGKFAAMDRLATTAASTLYPSSVTVPVFSLLVGVGVLASVSAFLVSGSRVAFAMARRGQFPSFAGAWNASINAPVPAVALTGAAAAGLAWSGTLRELLDNLGTGLTMLGILFGISAIVLRRRPDYRPTYRMPLYPLPILVFLATAVVMILGKAVGSPRDVLWSGGVILLGIPLYFAYRWSRGAERDGNRTELVRN